MNDLMKIDTYKEFKTALDTELKNQAEGFVRTGYLLKKARDTEILKESAYTSVAEFAAQEYGLSKDIVSRYIAINDRYSVNGYSDHLQEKYKGYGVAKLQEMLVLPDSIVELTSPEMSKREIQTVKKEYKEEAEKGDIEVMLEGQNPEQEQLTVLHKFLNQYFYENREKYIELAAVMEGKLTSDEAVEKVLDVMAPSGMAIIPVRIRGIGKLMLSIKGKDNDVVLLNIRNDEKETLSWNMFIASMHSENVSREKWEEIYKAPFEVKKEEKQETKEKSKDTGAELEKASIVEKKPEYIETSEEKKATVVPEQPQELMNPPEEVKEEATKVQTEQAEHAEETASVVDNTEIKSKLKSQIRQLGYLYENELWPQLIATAEQIIKEAEKIQATA